MKSRFQILQGLAVLSCAGFCSGFIASAVAATSITDPKAYFYAPIGSVWHYQGTLHEREVQFTSTNAFTNSATAIKTMEKDGQRVTVFIETNPGNMGETESYYYIGNDGVVYHGSQPQQLFEQQLLPYPVVKFPLIEEERFRQFNVKQRNFFQDLDGDGINEHVDAFADVTVAPLETLSVPAGTFHNVLRLDGRMEINVTMSSSGEVIVTRDRLTSWFAPRVGLIKYVEAIDVPVMGDVTMRITVVTEELEDFRIVEPSLGYHAFPPSIFARVSVLPLKR